MIKSKINVNNPLTVIAIFSMLTEASAAAALPYIDSENQKIYVWFLIIFPSFLITLFFLTLNFNNKTLYTPADFSKEKKYLTAHNYAPRTPDDQNVSFNDAGSFTPPPPAPLLSTSGITFSSAPPPRFTFLPHSHKGYKPEQVPFLPDIAQVTARAAPQPLLDLKHLHLVDLNHPSWQLTHEKTLGNIMNDYYEAIREPENKAHQNDVFIILTTSQTDSPVRSQYRSMSESKNTSPFGHASVMTYNTGTHEFNRLSPY